MWIWTQTKSRFPVIWTSEKTKGSGFTSMHKHEIERKKGMSSNPMGVGWTYCPKGATASLTWWQTPCATGCLDEQVSLHGFSSFHCDPCKCPQEIWISIWLCPFSPKIMHQATHSPSIQGTWWMVEIERAKSNKGLPSCLIFHGAVNGYYLDHHSQRLHLVSSLLKSEVTRGNCVSKLEKKLKTNPLLCVKGTIYGQSA